MPTLQAASVDTLQRVLALGLQQGALPLANGQMRLDQPDAALAAVNQALAACSPSALSRLTRCTACSCGPACAIPMGAWPSCALAVRALWAVAIRHDRQRPVMGWYVLLQRADEKTAFG